MPLLRALLVAVLAASAAVALEQPQPPPEPPSEELVTRLFAEKDYARAEEVCRRLLQFQPDNANTAYNLACALARQGKADEAMKALRRAYDSGFSDGGHARTDDDLASVRERPDFMAVVTAMDARPISTGAAYEPGEDLPGLRTVEGEPQGGLRWRLRIAPEATAEKPHRLVVWLHCSGASVNKPVEALAPDLAKHGYALAVFTQKQWVGWSEKEAAALAPTIADIAKTPGVDAAQPILMGFSAGGQMALLLWKAQPTAYGGLLIDAAYPVNAAERRVMDLPPADVAKHTPIMALVGDKDGNLQVWTAAMPAMAKLGIPVELRTVPGRGHEFLFAGDDWKASLAWLEKLRASAAAKPDAATPP
jgi:predicted esterase